MLPSIPATQETATKTIASFWQASHATPDCSNSRSTDYKGWARGLKACGYATNPQYANKLIQIIELYKLYEYDKAKRYDRFMASP